MDPRLHLFGIRHHGPGSAASLKAALDALQPEIVLIEGPPEADGLIAYAGLPGMKPPLALLSWASDKPSCSGFFPFAEFSPEWQAMLWALRAGRGVRFIDLPMAVNLAAELKELELQEAGEMPLEEAATEPSLAFRGDPLDLLAEISGHGDGEELWNALVESRGAGPDVFAALGDAMTALRAEIPNEVRGAAYALRETRREAHMRLKMREALKACEGPIAVVVGAWHVPALQRKVAAAEDKALLKDLPKVKIDQSWVPWTEGRLAFASGYGAGVASPGWYGHLWTLYAGESAGTDAGLFCATWLSRVAALLRGEGMAASTASVIEASRLAVSLAAMRNLPMPGLAEMRDATLAVLCHGDETPFRLIEQRLIIGEKIGELDSSVPQMPLAADLALWQKRLRLKPEAVEQELALDLRSESGLARSILLHRLTLIDVPWGRLIDAGAGRGTFREIWRLAWAPELSVKLAEALVHGITVEQAAAGAALAKATAGTQIQELSELVHHCLLADLPQAAERCIALLQAAAVNAADIGGLMRAVPPLVTILRYGTARKMPVEELTALTRALIVEVNAGVVLAAVNLDDNAAKLLLGAMTAFDDALGLFGDEHLSGEWQRQLARIAGENTISPLIAGFAQRRLYDSQAQDEAAIAAAFARALSPGALPKAVGQWLEGFLGDNAEVVLQDEILFGLIDSWLIEQEEDAFIEVLPMLRRAFSGFEGTGRKRLLDMISRGRQGGPLASQRQSTSFEAPGFAAALPLLQRILGIDTHA